MSLTKVDLVLEAQRVAKLVNSVGLALATPLDHFAYVFKVAIDEVDLMAVYGEPAAAIHPQTPVAESSHELRDAPVIQIASCDVQFLYGKRRIGIIVEPDVSV